MPEQVENEVRPSEDRIKETRTSGSHVSQPDKEWSCGLSYCW